MKSNRSLLTLGQLDKPSQPDVGTAWDDNRRQQPQTDLAGESGDDASTAGVPTGGFNCTRCSLLIDK
ncbi:hypothetical protein EVAR_88145_1 [Eumeta japonica]|uniref:Uncharacterized protein n=1 Tax=Eumeta variegata TaxID=151549 RepID=A0A4C1WPP9_EUMVA|nr:hypothetical protein EVAR_88145_1 [Eumeta japonica]